MSHPQRKATAWPKINKLNVTSACHVWWNLIAFLRAVVLMHLRNLPSYTIQTFPFNNSNDDSMKVKVQEHTLCSILILHHPLGSGSWSLYHHPWNICLFEHVASPLGHQHCIIYQKCLWQHSKAELYETQCRVSQHHSIPRIPYTSADSVLIIT